MNEMTFEEIITRLEEIKVKLSNNDIELESLINLYEEGKRLSILAQEKLNIAISKVEDIQIEE